MSRSSTSATTPRRHLSSNKMGVHAFRQIIRPNVNVIVRLDFELDYFDVTIQHISYYATERPLEQQKIVAKNINLKNATC